MCLHAGPITRRGCKHLIGGQHWADQEQRDNHRPRKLGGGKGNAKEGRQRHCRKPENGVPHQQALHEQPFRRCVSMHLGSFYTRTKTPCQRERYSRGSSGTVTGNTLPRATAVGGIGGTARSLCQRNSTTNPSGIIRSILCRACSAFHAANFVQPSHNSGGRMASRIS